MNVLKFSQRQKFLQMMPSTNSVLSNAIFGAVVMLHLCHLHVVDLPLQCHTMKFEFVKTPFMFVLEIVSTHANSENTFCGALDTICNGV